MGLKGKIFKFMSDILKDGSYYQLYTQAKSTSACGLPKGFFYEIIDGFSSIWYLYQPNFDLIVFSYDILRYVIRFTENYTNIRF